MSDMWTLYFVPLWEALCYAAFCLEYLVYGGVVPFMPTNAPLAGCRCKDAALLFGGQRALLCVYIFM